MLIEWNNKNEAKQTTVNDVTNSSTNLPTANATTTAAALAVSTNLVLLSVLPSTFQKYTKKTSNKNEAIQLATKAIITTATKVTPAAASGAPDLLTTSIRPTYSTIRTGIIRLTPESMKCKLYCKKSACRYCTAGAWPIEQQVLDGLYSSWVVANKILAMARPTSVHFEKHALLEQFHKNGIGTVINLQCGGEHAFCGPPLHTADGFTYNPEFLMRNKCRTGTLIACYLVWSTDCSANKAIEAVRRARPNSIQSIKQINVVVQMERMLRQLAAALPCPAGGDSAAYVLPLSIILSNQRRALPNDEARKFSHIPKLMFLVCDYLLKLVFEKNGVQYNVPNTSSFIQDDLSPSTSVNDTNNTLSRMPFCHNVRACTFGTLKVNWRNAFTHTGRAQVRYIMNLFVRLSAFPYDVDHRLRSEFRRISLVSGQIDAELAQMDASQLVHLLNACLESIQRPYCSNAQLIRAIEWFAPHNSLDIPPPVIVKTSCDCEVNYYDRNVDDENDDSDNTRRITNAAWSRARIPPKMETRTVSKTLKTATQHNSNSGCSKYCAAEKEKRPVHINEDWHCMVFHLLNVLSYLSNENYDVLTDLVSYWLTGDAYADVKAAVYCHMRELFVRNMHQQDEQTALYRRQVTADDIIFPSTSRSFEAISQAPNWNYF